MASATARPRYRARVVPRQGASRGSRVRWDRVGRMALLIVIFAVLVSYVGPTIHVFQSWRESKAATSRLAERKAENEALTRRVEAIDSPAATIAEARKQGLVTAGEQPYVIKGLK